MTPQGVALHLAGSRGLSRMVGCGCLAVAATAAMPLFLGAAVLGGALPGGPGAIAARDPMGPSQAGGVVMGSGQPLQPGRFRVSQGFGCTAVALEPRPPRPYVCPPNADHTAAVRFHTGIDLAAAADTSIYAVAAGTVRVIAGATGFGLHVVLAPSGPGTSAVTYLYGHLSVAAVSDGDHVPAGSLIGLVGSSGNSTGPHLHFEVDVSGVPVNPCSVFPRGYLVPPGVAAVDCEAWAL